MKVEKIRGHKRKQKEVQKWIMNTLPLNLDFLNKWQYEYAEILIHPWSGISIINNVTPEPKSKTKALMLKGLIDIYKNWKVELDKLGKPYYLKIWLYEPRFSKSQVVCATGDKIEYYDNHFRKAKNTKAFKNRYYGDIEKELSNFSWELAIDDEVRLVSDFEEKPDLTAKDGYEYYIFQQRLLKKIKSNPKVVREIFGDNEPGYCLPKGDIWLGQIN